MKHLLTADSRNDKECQYPYELFRTNYQSAYFADTNSNCELNDDYKFTLEYVVDTAWYVRVIASRGL